jgi:hypothetical protein
MEVSSPYQGIFSAPLSLEEGRLEPSIYQRRLSWLGIIMHQFSFNLLSFGSYGIIFAPNHYFFFSAGNSVEKDEKFWNLILPLLYLLKCKKNSDIILMRTCYLLFFLNSQNGAQRLSYVGGTRNKM